MALLLSVFFSFLFSTFAKFKINTLHSQKLCSRATILKESTLVLYSFLENDMGQNTVASYGHISVYRRYDITPNMKRNVAGKIHS